MKRSPNVMNRRNDYVIMIMFQCSFGLVTIVLRQTLTNLNLSFNAKLAIQLVTEIVSSCVYVPPVLWVLCHFKTCITVTQLNPFCLPGILTKLLRMAVWIEGQ